MNELDRVTIASRVFCFAGVLGLSAAAGNLPAVQSVVMLGAIIALAVAVGLTTTLSDSWIAVGEAFLVSLVVGLTLPEGVVLLPYLAVPGLIAGMAGGLRALAVVLVADLAGFTMILVPFFGRDDLAVWEAIAPWLVACLGVGLLGSLLRQIGKVPETSRDPSYESAHRLLTQLRTLARQLSAGLDPIGMAAQLLAVVHAQLGDARSALFIRTEGGVLAPLAYQGAGAAERLTADHPVVAQCWAEMEPVNGAQSSEEDAPAPLSALPLRVGSRMFGVVITEAALAGEEGTSRRLMREIDDHSLRLDTALAFDEVRSVATAEERQRLAREIHDGIAQEIASLGYLVDDLSATAESDVQSARLRELRGELSRVVSELRLSLFDLRIEVDPGSGLGSALSDYVRLVGSRSPLTVHLTLDEAPTRLRAEVETELLRIAQEAVTNARKHSGAQNLWVDCHVRPPFARIEVRDDGRGISKGRPDSYGFRIMRERAARIGAALEVRPAEEAIDSPGTLVRVTVGDDSGASHPATTEGVEAWQSRHRLPEASESFSSTTTT